MSGDLTAVATWSASGEGERLWFLGTLATIRTPGEAVGDRYALIEFLFPHGASPPLHTLRVDSETARVLVLSTPAGLERFVRDGSVPAGAEGLPPADAPRPSPEELDRLFSAHGQQNLGPPLGPED